MEILIVNISLTLVSSLDLLWRRLLTPTRSRLVLRIEINHPNKLLPMPYHLIALSHAMNPLQPRRIPEREPASHADEGKEERTLPLPLVAAVHKCLPDLEEVRLELHERRRVVPLEDRLDAVRCVLGDCDGEERVVEDVLRGEGDAVDDEDGDTAGVDGVKGPR
jgi:hypothetical protein